MTENFVEFVLTLLDIANECAATQLGLKGKPYLHFDDFGKYGFNIKKQDKKLFMEAYKRIKEDDRFETFEDLLKNYNYITNYEKISDENFKEAMKK